MLRLAPKNGAIPRFLGSKIDNLGIGIHGISVYVPKRFVEQSELEKSDGVSAGKYTIGLGQQKMAFSGDSEDVCSMSLNAVSRLLSSTGVPQSLIGRLDVGTETIIDKSKSVKTTLMGLFGPEHTSLEGVDCVNACYGGVSALFSAADWCAVNEIGGDFGAKNADFEGKNGDFGGKIDFSRFMGPDGRYARRFAIVVATDIAVYAPGPARPTGGAGSVALLIGPDAPITFEAGLRASHFENAYDFYKPILDISINASRISIKNHKKHIKSTENPLKTPK
eukprot:TRINITY_DN7567_c0_g1_i2.p1 TRINITY_DN7567_c0_g1~~TRINITY_DN7567_c0_g1_i2.p1  ORF type:complete len:279 (-),score=49.67 TRINITY_DN7567_c0_g1_i2:102-938(-)